MRDPKYLCLFVSIHTYREPEARAIGHVDLAESFLNPRYLRSRKIPCAVPESWSSQGSKRKFKVFDNIFFERSSRCNAIQPLKYRQANKPV